MQLLEDGELCEPMKCVSSGYPHHDRSCRMCIPASVVVKAWLRKRDLEGGPEGFFRFSWRGGTWLAYGTADDGVRGVYCPTHCSERNAREVRAERRSDGRPRELALR